MPPTDQKLKIAFLGTQMEVAGAQRVLLSQAAWFHSHGYSVEVLFLYDKTGMQKEWAAQYAFPVLSLNAWGKKSFPIFGFFAGFVRLVIRLRAGIDVLVTHTPHSNFIGLLAGWLAGVPVRVAIHHGKIAATGGLFARLHGWAINSRLCSRLVAVSNSVRNHAMAGERVKPEKIVLIENGIDLARSQLSSEQKAELRKSLGLKEDHVVFLTVGRLAQEKGHTVLLEAISQVGDDPAFLFAGDGPLRAQLEERADQLGIQPRVRFLGVRDDVPALLGIADGFIQPSLSEGLSLAFLEALAAGVPVISSRVGGAVDIIEEHDAGILVPAGDAAALAAAIAQLAGDAQLRARLGRAGQAAVQQRYSVERMCGQYATLFDELSHER